jgi:peptide deformylase
VFQHEIDHLNGKLFIDTASKIRDADTLLWSD